MKIGVQDILECHPLETMPSFTNTNKAPLKISIVPFVLEANTGDVGGFLPYFIQVQHY